MTTALSTLWAIFLGLAMSLGILALIVAIIVLVVACVATVWTIVAPRVALFIAEYKKAGVILDQEQANVTGEIFYDESLDLRNN